MKSKIETNELTEQQQDRFACALQRVGGDQPMLIILAEMASEDAPVLLEKLESEIQAGSLDGAARTAHALKGLLSTFETGSPVEEVQALIDGARSDDRLEVTRLFRGLQPRLANFIEEVNALTKPG